MGGLGIRFLHAAFDPPTGVQNTQIPIIYKHIAICFYRWNDEFMPKLWVTSAVEGAKRKRLEEERRLVPNFEGGFSEF